MSLILDALRRADSERDRERGAVPGLHAQQVAVAPEAPPAAGMPPWLWLAIVAGAGVAAALVAWVVAGRDAPRPAAAASSPPAAAPAPAPQPASAIAAAPSAAPRESASASQPVAEPAPWPSQDAGRRAPTAGVVSAPAAAAEAKAASAAAVPVEPAIVRREQLPENIRTQLPPLIVGGSIYSANPPDRSIIIDGRLLRENDRLAAELALEQIRPKSAVLRFRGQRFEIGF